MQETAIKAKSFWEDFWNISPSSLDLTVDLRHEYIYIHGKEMGKVIEIREVLHTLHEQKAFAKILLLQSLFTCSSISGSNNFSQRSQDPSCCSQAVQPSLTIHGATVLGNGNHWLAGVTVRLTVRCTRPGHLCCVFQWTFGFAAYLIAIARRAILAPRACPA